LQRSDSVLLIDEAFFFTHSLVIEEQRKMMVYRHEDRPKKASVTVTVDGQFDDPVEAPTPRGVDVPKPQHDVPPGLAPEKDPPHASSVVPQIQQQQVPPAMMMQSMSGFGFPMMAPPGMQPVMIRPAQYVLVPQPMFFPGATAQYQPYQQSQTTPHVAATCTNSTSPETQWHIPMSHNYHPAVGIVPDKQQKSDAAHNLLRLASLHRTKEDIKTPPNPIAESNPMFEDGEPFPIIKEDADYKFPIEESEVNEVDVLCGRGGATNAHPGELLYFALNETLSGDLMCSLT
jgi:hypothetical protein